MKIHKIKLHAGVAVCLNSQFIYIWRCLAIVHDHSVNNHSIHNSSGLQCISVDTGHFENVNGAKFGQFLFSRISTNMTASEPLFLFKELDSYLFLLQSCGLDTYS